MKDIRDTFLVFLEDQDLSNSLIYSSVVTNLHVKELRYTRLDRYDFSLLTKEQISAIMQFVIEHHEYIDIYFAFGQLCIGYYDRRYGVQKRLVAFEKSSCECEVV